MPVTRLYFPVPRYGFADRYGSGQGSGDGYGDGAGYGAALYGDGLGGGASSASGDGYSGEWSRKDTVTDPLLLEALRCQ